MNKFSERRLLENEVLFRSANREVQRQVKKDQLTSLHADNTKLHFYCECSNIECRDRIKLTSQEYEASAKGKKQFIVLPGHDNSQIEKVIKQSRKYSVVEKFLDPAKAVGAEV